jgi:hypothetical protein
MEKKSAVIVTITAWLIKEKKDIFETLSVQLSDDIKLVTDY